MEGSLKEVKCHSTLVRLPLHHPCTRPVRVRTPPQNPQSHAGPRIQLGRFQEGNAVHSQVLGIPQKQSNISIFLQQNREIFTNVN